MPNLIKTKTHYEFMTIATLPDGTDLSARVWLPLSLVNESGNIIGSAPTILEYLPYRLMDGTRKRDDITYAYFAMRGYAGIRIDIRGNGDSQGLFDDEYSESELNDGYNMIAWIAEQNWCDGNVGMIGISWGGFNGLQIAYMQPPALKAVVTACSTHDRYNGDIHYKGGCQMTDNFTWSQQMLSYCARSPDPEIFGDGWRDEWKKRLDNMPILLKNWLDHQRRDDYWKHGSVCEDYSKVNIPVFAMGGWQDAYTKTIFRLCNNLQECQAILGPWEHAYPHIAVVEPRVDFLGMACDFWDKHLKGTESVDRKLQAYIMQSQKPQRNYGARKGYWVEVPSDYQATPERLYINEQELGREEKAGGIGVIDSPPRIGAGRQNFCPGMRLDGELADDQAADDSMSLCFDTEALTEAITLLGETKIHLRLSSDKPVANVVARVCDVAPNGEVHLIAWGCLNLAHRGGSEQPEAMPIDTMEDVEFPLNPCGYELAAGHKLRLSLSNYYWPMMWPAPENTQIKVELGASYLDLPMIHGANKIDLPATERVMSDLEQITKGHNWRKYDDSDGKFICEIFDDFGEIKYPETGVRITEQVYECSEIGNDADSAKMSVEWQRTHVRDGSWNIRMITGGDVWVDKDYFHIKVHWQVFDGDAEFHSYEFTDKIKRDFM